MPTRIISDHHLTRGWVKTEESARDLKQAAQLGHSGAQMAINDKSLLPHDHDD